MIQRAPPFSKQKKKKRKILLHRTCTMQHGLVLCLLLAISRSSTRILEKRHLIFFFFAPIDNALTKFNSWWTHECLLVNDL